MDDLANEFPAFNAAWKPFNQVYLTNGCVLNSYQMFTKAPINNLGDFNGQKIAGAGVDLHPDVDGCEHGDRYGVDNPDRGAFVTARRRGIGSGSDLVRDRHGDRCRDRIVDTPRSRYRVSSSNRR